MPALVLFVRTIKTSGSTHDQRLENKEGWRGEKGNKDTERTDCTEHQTHNTQNTQNTEHTEHAECTEYTEHTEYRTHRTRRIHRTHRTQWKQENFIQCDLENGSGESSYPDSSWHSAVDLAHIWPRPMPDPGQIRTSTSPQSAGARAVTCNVCCQHTCRTSVAQHLWLGNPKNTVGETFAWDCGGSQLCWWSYTDYVFLSPPLPLVLSIFLPPLLSPSLSPSLSLSLSVMLILKMKVQLGPCWIMRSAPLQ